MEFEEIGKRLEWLDKQQRTIKTDLKDLSGRSSSIEASINVVAQQVKTLNEQMNELSLAAARINQFEQLVSRQRTDLGKMIETAEKNGVRREQESLKLHHAEMEEIRKTVFQLNQAISAEEAAKKDRVHEEQRRALAAQDTRAAVDTAVRQGKEMLEAQKRLDETQRQDAKRLADLQGELASVRKRTDEVRETTALHADGIRNTENRINELLQAETSRLERQAALQQQQALAQVERDRAWKEWQEKYEVFKQQATSVEGQVAAFDDAIRAAQRAQEAYNDLNQKLERRIAEVGEMQRLGEDRVRQEWVSFKAEEQKRWTGYSLSQDEATRDLRKDLDGIGTRLTSLDDLAEILQDQLQQTTDATEKQLQELMNVAHEWLSAYERIMGHAKTKNRKSVQ
jgi:chromosome segregation ATPase